MTLMHLQSQSQPALLRSAGARSTVRSLLNTPESSTAAFERRWGHAALLQLPTEEQIDRALMQLGGAHTMRASNGRAMVSQTLLMLRAFCDMHLDFLVGSKGQALVGRGVEAQLLLEHESVSKRHALLSWGRGDAWLQDLRSLNGSQVNGCERAGLMGLNDGDLIRLGDAHLLFVTAPTLFLQLESIRFSRLGAH